MFPSLLTIERVCGSSSSRAFTWLGKANDPGHANKGASILGLLQAAWDAGTAKLDPEQRNGTYPFERLSLCRCAEFS